MNRCVLCHKGVHGRRRRMMTIPKLDWERQKMVIEDLEGIDEKLKKQIWDGNHNKKLICKKHAPRMQMWKEEQCKLNPKPRKQWDWKYLVWSNPELRERMREHIRQGGSPENFAPPVQYPDGTVRVSTPFGEVQRQAHATEWLPSYGCESASVAGGWEKLPPSAGGWEDLPPSAGGWEQLPPSAGRREQLPSSAGGWDHLPPFAGGPGQLPCAGGWGQLPPSVGGRGQLPPSAGGWGQLPPSEGGWGQLPPSAGRWGQLPRGQLPPSAGRWGQLPPSAGGRGQLPPSAGGRGQLPASAGGWGQLPPSAGRWGQLPPSAGRWGQLPDSAGGCGQMPDSAGGSKKLPIKRETLDGQMPETSCENLSSGYGSDLSATEGNTPSELESWKRKIKTELEDMVGAPTTTTQDMSMPPPGSNYPNPFPLRSQYEPSCVGTNYNPQANARFPFNENSYP